MQNEADILFDERQLKKILDHLTHDNIAKIEKQLIGLLKNSADKRDRYIGLLFETAIKEVILSNECAKIIQTLATLGAVKKDKKVVYARSLLIRKCQKELERIKKDEATFSKLTARVKYAVTLEKKKKLTEKKDMMLRESKRRSKAFIKFIGELFLIDRLPVNFTFMCFSQLMDMLNHEDILEALCNVMMRIGHKMDAESEEKVNSIMEKLNAQAAKTSEGMILMVEKVKTLRGDKWDPDAPMKRKMIF